MLSGNRSLQKADEIMHSKNDGMLHSEKQTLHDVQQPQEALVHGAGALWQHGRSSSKCTSNTNQHQQVHPTHLLDVPAHLLESHMQHLQPQDKTALLQSSKALRNLALRSAPRLQFSMGIMADGQVREAQQRAPATAAWAISHCPGMTLRLHNTSSSSTKGRSSKSVKGSTPPSLNLMCSPAWLLPQLGQVLTSLVLEGLQLDALVPAAVSTLCPVLQRLTVRNCTLASFEDAGSAQAAAVLGTCTQLQHLSVADNNSDTQHTTAHSSMQHLTITHSDKHVRYSATQVSMLSQLPSLSSLQVQWPLVPVEQVQDVGRMASQLTSLTVFTRASCEAKAQNIMLLSLGRFTALHRLQVGYNASRLPMLKCPTSTLINKNVLQCWGSSLQQLSSLQLPHSVACASALHHLFNLQHVQLARIDADAAVTDGQACKWQQLQLGIAYAAELATLPVHSLLQPLAVSQLVVKWDDDSPAQLQQAQQQFQAAAANISGCKAGWVCNSLELCLSEDEVSSQQQAACMQAAAPLLKLFKGTSLHVEEGCLSDTVIMALQQCGALCCIECLRLGFDAQLEASFWQVAQFGMVKLDSAIVDWQGFCKRVRGWSDKMVEKFVDGWVEDTGRSLRAFLTTLPSSPKVYIILETQLADRHKLKIRGLFERKLQHVAVKCL